MASLNQIPPKSLLELLSNDLILHHTSPYIGISLVSLAATSKAFKSLVYDTPHVFQHVDLNSTKFFIWNTDESLMENQEKDGLYLQRYNTLLSTLEDRHVIQDIRTLILDDLYVPTAIVEDILFNERYQIRLLSLRGDFPYYRQRMHNLLQKLFLSDRLKISYSKGTLRLRGLYLFGQPSRIQESSNFRCTMNRPEATGVTASMGAQLGAGVHMANELVDGRELLREGPYSDSPFGALGMTTVLRSIRNTSEWADILEAYAGVIAFDAVLCRHNRKNFSYSGPVIATVRLAGCQTCGSCPEGPAYPGVSPADHLPLLSPPPLHSSKVEVAQRIDTNVQPYPPLIVRCHACLQGRWCENCNVWWCESCYTIPKDRSKGDPASTVSGPASNVDIKVQYGLCVSHCLRNELLNGLGEGGMWG